jgi:hypothetical protein
MKSRISALLFLFLFVGHNLKATTMTTPVDFSRLKTFGAMGKEVRPLKGNTEADIFDIAVRAA